jgi:hypothetical protein
MRVIVPLCSDLDDHKVPSSPENSILSFVKPVRFVLLKPRSTTPNLLFHSPEKYSPRARSPWLWIVLPGLSYSLSSAKSVQICEMFKLTQKPINALRT